MHNVPDSFCNDGVVPTGSAVLGTCIGSRGPRIPAVCVEAQTLRDFVNRRCVHELVVFHGSRLVNTTATTCSLYIPVCFDSYLGLWLKGRTVQFRLGRWKLNVWMGSVTSSGILGREWEVWGIAAFDVLRLTVLVHFQRFSAHHKCQICLCLSILEDSTTLRSPAAPKDLLTNDKLAVMHVCIIGRQNGIM